MLTYLINHTIRAVQRDSNHGVWKIVSQNNICSSATRFIYIFVPIGCVLDIYKVIF